MLKPQSILHAIAAWLLLVAIISVPSHAAQHVVEDWCAHHLGGHDHDTAGEIDAASATDAAKSEDDHRDPVHDSRGIDVSSSPVHGAAGGAGSHAHQLDAPDHDHPCCGRSSSASMSRGGTTIDLAVGLSFAYFEPIIFVIAPVTLDVRDTTPRHIQFCFTLSSLRTIILLT